MPKLESVSIGDLRAFDSIEGMLDLRNLRRIFLDGLPRLQGVLKLQNCEDLEIVYIVNTPLETDFTHVQKHQILESVWLNGTALNLDWEELLAIKNLKKIGIVESKADDIPIQDIAKRVDRQVVDYRVVGPKKRRQIQVSLA